jgi:aldose 1-epimerase
MKALLPTLAVLLLHACSAMPEAKPSVTVSAFGLAKNGQPATLWTLRSGTVEIDVTDHGATLVAVRTPDRAGFLADVVLGFDDVSGYESSDNQYFGCTTGRVANRIAKGKFTLDGYTYHLATNNGDNHLHGGALRSLDKVHWQASVIDRGAEPAVRFTYLSRNGEEGYPGNLRISATYRLLQNGQLRLDYEATTDQRTPVNLTNHAYWNLAGAGAPAAELLAHSLQIPASTYTATDATLIPTGVLADLRGSALDFQKPTAVGLRIAELDASPAAGYDHNYVLQSPLQAAAAGELPPLRRAAVLHHQGSGRSVQIDTTEPGLQVYSGNHLFGQRGKAGKSYPRRSAICLETQHFPDSVNQPTFPNTVLEPGQTYQTTTVWTFRAE